MVEDVDFADSSDIDSSLFDNKTEYIASGEFLTLSTRDIKRLKTRL